MYPCNLQVEDKQTNQSYLAENFAIARSKIINGKWWEEHMFYNKKETNISMFYAFRNGKEKEST